MTDNTKVKVNESGKRKWEINTVTMCIRARNDCYISWYITFGYTGKHIFDPIYLDILWRSSYAMILCPALVKSYSVLRLALPGRWDANMV